MVSRLSGLVLMIFVTAFTPATAISAEDEFVAAFRADANVRANVDLLTNHGLRAIKDPHRILVQGVCGTAGCSLYVLVVQVLETTGVNPQARYVAATVKKGVDQTMSVQMVRFAPLYAR